MERNVPWPSEKTRNIENWKRFLGAMLVFLIVFKADGSLLGSRHYLQLC